MCLLNAQFTMFGKFKAVTNKCSKASLAPLPTRPCNLSSPRGVTTACIVLSTILPFFPVHVDSETASCY